MMEIQLFTEKLVQFGLTRQEATVYIQLLSDGRKTGYEIAKATGISRSNAYGALAALVEKGAAYVVEESSKKYIPVALEEFCDNCIKKRQSDKQWMLDNLQVKKPDEEGYITIEGATHIADKIRTLIGQTEERVYISGSMEHILAYEKEIRDTLELRKKVVLITDQSFSEPGAKIYVSESKQNQIGVIVDSRYVLTGEYGDGSLNTCLYSGQKNFVSLFKTALANEIKLINYMKPKKGESPKNEKRNVRNESTVRGNYKRVSNTFPPLR